MPAAAPSLAFLFPGQGAQTPGFLRVLPAHPHVAATLDEASEALGMPAGSLDSSEALRSTVAVQLATLIAGVATARALRAEGIEPDAVAGLSIGTFGAAVTCGTLAFHDALRLARFRAECMERAYPHGYGLAAISGLTERELARRIEQVRKASSDAGAAFIANVNAPRQIVVAGSDAALDALMAAVRQNGARKVQRLAVAVPSHCALLEGAAAQLIEAFANVPLAAPRIPYIDNRGGRAIHTADGIRADLATNLARPVRWHDGTCVLYEMGARLFLEMPPGHALSDLARDAFPDARAVAMDGASLESIAQLIRPATTRAP